MQKNALCYRFNFMIVRIINLFQLLRKTWYWDSKSKGVKISQIELVTTTFNKWINNKHISCIYIFHIVYSTVLPIIDEFHYYVVCFNTKRMQIDIIDNSTSLEDHPLEFVHGKVPFVLVNFLVACLLHYVV